jgi:hypothetical protein
MQKAMYLLSVKAGEIVRISHLSFLTLLEFHIELFLLTAWPMPAHRKKKLEYLYLVDITKIWKRYMEPFMIHNIWFIEGARAANSA